MFLWPSRRCWSIVPPHLFLPHIMPMILRHDLQLVERRIIERARSVTTRPQGWNERDHPLLETTHHLLLIVDWVQCNLTDHLNEMRAADNSTDWRLFVDMLRTHIEQKDVAAAGWEWLIEIIVSEYTAALRGSWAWAVSVVHVDSAYATATGKPKAECQEVHLLVGSRTYELEDREVRIARRVWYDLHDGGAGGKRRMIQLLGGPCDTPGILQRLRHSNPANNKEVTLADGPLAPTKVASAVNDGDIDTIASWIENGESPDAIMRIEDQTGPRLQRCPGTRLLAVAARKGFLSVAERLLAAGANVELPNDDGVTALMVAAAEGQAALVRCLLVSKADALTSDYDGQTALEHAQLSISRRNKQQDRDDIVQLLSQPESVFAAPFQGLTILLTGLATRPQLNGQRGVATSFDAMSGRYTVQIENGLAVRVRPNNLAKFDAPPVDVGDAAAAPAAEDPRGLADQRLRQAMDGDDINLEDLKVAISETDTQASAALLKEARRKRDQLKERARKAAKQESERQRKVRAEAQAAIAAASAAEEAARAAQELAARQEEEAALLDEALCVVCLDRPKTHIFVPCGHYSCCEECCNLLTDGPAAMRRCPLCKGVITMGMKVFG